MSLAARERGLLVVLVAGILALFRGPAWSRVLDCSLTHFQLGVLFFVVAAGISLMAFHRRAV